MVLINSGKDCDNSRLSHVFGAYDRKRLLVSRRYEAILQLVSSKKTRMMGRGSGREHANDKQAWRY
jgi:hypothetical protein